MNTRAAAVAGTFYDADSSRLQRQVSALVNAASAPPEAIPEAIIVPHAGYIYSGSTAAFAFRYLIDSGDTFKRVLLVGPAHRVFVRGMAIPSVDQFETPLGSVDLDRDGLQQLRAMPGIEVTDDAHRDEHCLEVQLPFLQTLLRDFTLLPVLVGGAGADTVGALIDCFANDSKTLILISSDLSHFLPYRQAQKKDAETCELILKKSTSLIGEQACGARAINGLMASELGRQSRISLLHACNSGDSAGNPNRVVGYAAFALH